MTASPSSITEDQAIRHAALVYQQPSLLADFTKLSGIVRDVLHARRVSNVNEAVAEGIA